MNLPQRLFALLGSVGALHSAMVPPVSGGECRYHAFLEAAKPFTRLYEVPGGSPTALLSELALIASATLILILVAGFWSTGQRTR